MISIDEPRYERLVALGISFEPRDSLLDGALKPGTDFIAFIESAVGDHGGLLGPECVVRKNFAEQSQVFPTRADISEDP
jgi:hypothetical protein